ncbi:MAG: DUF4013 domain-containing protein [Phycisphaerales bacterium]|nr:DUF4013 domain-containing protein [Phycisphaerales bacterium]
MTTQHPITLASPLTLPNAFRFPLQSRASRRDLLIGGLVLLIPFVGWLLNMGHRIVVAHRMLHDDPNPWPAWGHPLELLKHGLITFAGMVLYHIPAAIVIIFAQQLNSVLLYALAALLWMLGTCVVPGYMTAYCVSYDPREVFNITRSIRRVLNARSTYWKAWAITFCAMLTSFAGLLGLGLLFFWTSVWFWQAAAFCFANTMTRTSIELPTTQ